MRRAVRVGLVVLGAAMAVYGSLTGAGSDGMEIRALPPWPSESEASAAEFGHESTWHSTVRTLKSDGWMFPGPHLASRYDLWGGGGYMVRFSDRPPNLGQLTVAAAGLALFAVGAWPRRRAGAIR